MQRWIKRSLFAVFAVTVLVAGLSACGHRSHEVGTHLPVAGAKFDAARAQALVTDKTTALQTKSSEVIAALADFYDNLNPAQQHKVRDYMNGPGHWFHRG